MNPLVLQVQQKLLKIRFMAFKSALSLHKQVSRLHLSGDWFILGPLGVVSSMLENRNWKEEQ